MANVLGQPYVERYVEPQAVFGLLAVPGLSIKIRSVPPVQPVGLTAENSALGATPVKVRKLRFVRPGRNGVAGAEWAKSDKPTTENPMTRDLRKSVMHCSHS